MSGTPLTHDQWEALLQAFRDDPGNISGASRVSGVSRPTARRAWNEGWPHLDPPRKPIKVLLHEEQIAARAAGIEAASESAARRAEAENERAFAEAERARKDAVDARRAEAGMVRSQRANVLDLIKVTNGLLKSALRRSHVLHQAIEKGIDPATGKQLTLHQQLNLLTRVSLLLRRCGDSGQAVLKMERLLLGEPTEIIGTKSLDDVNFEEAVQEIEQAAQIAARAKERKARMEERKLRVVNGGAGNE